MSDVIDEDLFLFTPGVSDEALRNVANAVVELTCVTRHYNGRGRSRTYAGDIDAIASAARQLADMVLNALDENHYRYCPCCGRAIVEAHDAEEQSEDE